MPDAAANHGQLAFDVYQLLCRDLQWIFGQNRKIGEIAWQQWAFDGFLSTIPGIGIIGATAIAAAITDPKAFRSGRDFAAWIGLVPREDSTGGKRKPGPISKQGDRYLRRILVVGAHSVLRRAPRS
jgi:transposase